MRWSTHNSNVCICNFTLYHFRYWHECIFFNSFCHTDDYLIILHKRCHTLCCTSCKHRRYCKNKHITFCYCHLKICCKRDIFLKLYARKFIYMLSFFIEHSYFIFNYGPDNYVMSVLCKNNCKSCTPASCSDYTYFLHIYFAFCPNLFSVPFSNLDMLARCLHIAITVKQATTISNSKTYAGPIFISPL